MALTAGVISKVFAGGSEIKLSSTPASGGVGPYTVQWYRSETTGFAPGGGNILAGQTSLQLDDQSGLIPNTQYYYKAVYTDTGFSNDTVTSAEFAQSTSAADQSPNAFAQSPLLGMLDLRFNPDTVAVQLDASQSGSLFGGSAVKMVDSADGIPKVIGCDANDDAVLGFINYDIKSRAYLAGDRAEISMDQNVMFLYATGPIARGAQVSLDVSSPGAVRSVADADAGDSIVGWAYDKAGAAGALIRIKLSTPSFAVVA